jgi:hypothetical protein
MKLQSFRASERGEEEELEGREASAHVGSYRKVFSSRWVATIMPTF